MGYSRDEVVSELLSYYEFLVGMYLPPEALKRPPARGWPNLTTERLAFLGKTDSVVDLLRHLPYISRDNDRYQIYEKCFGNDFTGVRFDRAVKERNVIETEPQAEVAVLEPHVATLAKAEGATGWYIYCNTNTGEMELVDYMSFGSRLFPNAKELFEKMKDDFRELKHISLEPQQVALFDETYSDEYEPIQGAFWSHGWPTSEYSRDLCLLEIQRIRKLQYEARQSQTTPQAA